LPREPINNNKRKTLQGSLNALATFCIIHVSASPIQRRYIQSYNEISSSTVQLYFATDPKALFITTDCVFGRRSKDAAHRDHKSRARRRVLVSRCVSFKLTLKTSLSLSVKTSHWPNSSRFGGQVSWSLCDAHTKAKTLPHQRAVCIIISWKSCSCPAKRSAKKCSHASVARSSVRSEVMVPPCGQ